MSISIKGLDKLASKLNKISNLETKAIVNEVADDVEKTIKAKAQEFSSEQYQHIKKATPREYGNSCFIDVGLKNDEVDFDLWRGLWFQNWGYNNNGTFVDKHIMWFNEAVQSVENESIQKIKRKLSQEIRALK